MRSDDISQSERSYTAHSAFGRIPVLAALLIMTVMVVTGCGSKASIPDEYDYDLSQYIVLPEYKGIEYKKADFEVSDVEVRTYIDSAVSSSGSTVKNTTGTVKKDSIININYSGSIDGEKFDGGTAEDVILDIANNTYIDGFADSIVGHKAGETFDINVTFPEDYSNERLAGKDAVFTITVNYISEDEIPEYNDEWVKANTEYSTTAEYEQAVTDELSASKKADYDKNARMEVFNHIFDNTEVIKYPEKELEDRKARLKASYQEYAAALGMEFDAYLAVEMGIGEEEFDKLAEESAKTAVKTEMIIYSIADKEGINITPSEYNDYMLGLLKDAGYTEDTYKEEKGYTIQEYAEDNNLYTAYLYQLVMDKVMEYSVAK